MLWLKLLGCLSVLSAGVLTSVSLNRAADRLLARLDGFIALLRFVKVQIECYCVPVGEILRRCDGSVLAACGVERAPDDFFALIEGLTPSPDEKIAAVLRSFAAELGGSYRNEQIKSCEYHISRLCDLRTPLVAETATRKRLNTALCLSASAAIVIFLL